MHGKSWPTLFLKWEGRHLPLQRETNFFLYNRKCLPVILPLSRTGIVLCDHCSSRSSRKKHKEKATN